MGTDGVGITTLAAAAGCPLHCRWCINKELLLKAKPENVTPEEFLERVRIDDLYFRATGGEKVRRAFLSGCLSFPAAMKGRIAPAMRPLFWNVLWARTPNRS